MPRYLTREESGMLQSTLLTFHQEMDSHTYYALGRVSRDCVEDGPCEAALSATFGQFRCNQPWGHTSNHHQDYPNSTIRVVWANDQ